MNLSPSRSRNHVRRTYYQRDTSVLLLGFLDAGYDPQRLDP